MCLFLFAIAVVILAVIFMPDMWPFFLFTVVYRMKYDYISDEEMAICILFPVFDTDRKIFIPCVCQSGKRRGLKIGRQDGMTILPSFRDIRWA